MKKCHICDSDKKTENVRTGMINNITMLYGRFPYVSDVPKVEWRICCDCWKNGWRVMSAEDGNIDYSARKTVRTS